MSEFKVSQLGDVQRIDNGEASWETQYGADVFVEPPVTIGDYTGSYISGCHAGTIALGIVSSNADGTHASLHTIPSESSSPVAVVIAIGRLREYLNTPVEQLTELRQRYASTPLIVEHDNRSI